MRQEIKDYMKMSKRLIALAVQSDQLSEEECQILDYYATELQTKVHGSRDAGAAFLLTSPSALSAFEFVAARINSRREAGPRL
jgi:hypothetical protein